jgi:hypothetical protein
LLERSKIVLKFSNGVMQIDVVSFQEIRGRTDSVSEIEFCTLYVVTERWILAACCGSCA